MALTILAISFFGLLIVGVLLALLAIVGARVLPTATEFMAIQKAANFSSRTSCR